jgi:hypothetical protein
MRLWSRWFVVIAFVCTVVLAGAPPVFDHAASSTSTASASTDGASSGFKSQPAPEKPAYIGPGLAIPGATVLNALVPSPSLLAWPLPGRATTAASPALRASRVSPHLRSIPLLI